MNSKLVAILALGAGLMMMGLYFRMEGSQMTKYQKMAFEINSNPTSTWEAVSEPRVSFNISNSARMFNLVIDDIPANFDVKPELLTDVEDLPENFDSREKWTGCESIKEIRDQSACGSCWAFGAASAMSDRLCIKSGQTDQRRVSTADLVSCCHSCGFGCSGGYLYQTWAYWQYIGVSTGGQFDDNRWCKPYPFAPCNHHSQGPYSDCGKYHYDTPKCVKSCTNKNYKTEYAKDLIKGASVYKVDGSEDDIRRELFQNGPIEAAFTVYEDFLLYKSGVYIRQRGSQLGGHAVKLIGWGIENGVKYWLIVNSWNENWGDKGTFKILRGKDHCGIESNLVTGIPKL